MKIPKAPEPSSQPQQETEATSATTERSVQTLITDEEKGTLHLLEGDGGDQLILTGLYPLEVLSTYRTVFDGLDIGILLQGPNLEILAANRTVRELLWLSDSQQSAPTLQAVDESGAPIAPDQLPPIMALKTASEQKGRVIGLNGPDGRLTWFEVSSKPILVAGESQPYAVLTSLSDISKFKKQQKELRYQAQHDTLTNLPNRQAFLERLTEVGQDSQIYAVMYLDLDGFKKVNDTFGHAVGDQLLAAAAKRLKRCVRPQDLAARLAGDEFAILLHQISSKSEADTIASRILSRIRQPFRFRDGVITLSTSIGIAFGSRDVDPKKVIVNADYALQHVKQNGKNRYAVFDQQLSHHQATRSQIETDLKHALRLAQLDVYYQPLFEAKGRSLVGIEALMRWQHPEHGTINPADFLPVAEKTGLIIEMEAWLLETAMRQLSNWNERHPKLQLSINLSSKQLAQPEFLTVFEEALVASSADPENVVLDISEGFAMKRSIDNIRVTNELSELGLTLAIDDFGTGYSNLGTLKDLPFDIVKIDRSFLEGVPNNLRNTALVKTILAMAEALELSVVAEGIETDAQAHFLYWEGARWLQGFYFSPPLSAAQLSKTYLTEP